MWFDCQIDKVLLVGGSTRLQLVHNILKKFGLDAKLQKESVKTDEMVLYGAGFLAYYLSQNTGKVQFCILPCWYIQNFHKLCLSLKCMIDVKDVLTYTIFDNGKFELVKRNKSLDGKLRVPCAFNSSVGGFPFKVLLIHFLLQLLNDYSKLKTTTVMCADVSTCFRWLLTAIFFLRNLRHTAIHSCSIDQAMPKRLCHILSTSQ